MRVLIFAAALVRVAAAQPGMLDPTFGDAGIVRLDLGGDERGEAAAALADGRLLVAGTSGAEAVVVRLLADGTPDAGFGDGGIVRVPSVGTVRVTQLAVLADGRFYVGGYGASDLVLLRFLSDGRLDATFGTDGIATLDLGGADFALGLALLSDGRVVLGGGSVTAAGSAVALARLLPDGAPDPSFGESGRVVLPLDGFAIAITLQPDGRLLVAGTVDGVDTDTDLFVSRLLTDGTPDTTFGVACTTRLDLGAQESANALAVQPDGRIVVVGSAGFEELRSLVRVRLLPDGSPDPSFANGTLFVPEHQLRANAVALLPDGAMLVGGGGPDGPDGLARLTPDGALDAGFGDDGVVWGALGAPGSGRTVLIQPDGKAVMAGRGGQPGDLAVARYLDAAPVGGEAIPASRPPGLALSPPSPSPFDGLTTLTLSSDGDAPVTVDVVDVLGRRVAMLYAGPLPAGRHRLTLPGEGLAPGVYVVRARQRSNAATQRVVRR